MLRLVWEFLRRMSPHRRGKMTKVIVSFFLLIIMGAVGYKHFEGAVNPDLTWGDSIWWSIVTMTTVGYGDYYPTTVYGRYLVAMPVMFIGIGILGYLLSVLATSFIELRSKELKGMSELTLESHVLLVHFQSQDRNLEIIKELTEDVKTKNLPIVLIDEHLEELPHDFLRYNIRFVRGNPSKASVLNRACVYKASYAIVLANDINDTNADAHTLAAALTIEALNPSIFTVAECLDPERVELMRRSGCDSVVCMARLSSSFMVQEVSDPGTQALVNELTTNRFGQQVYIAPIERMKSWKFSELQSFLDVKGFLVMGLRRGEETRLNPGRSYEVQKDDLVICIGPTRPDPIRISS